MAVPKEFNHLKKNTITFDCNEGDLTVEDKEVWHSGAEAPVNTWADPIRKGHFLIMDSVSWRVKNAPAATQTLVGTAAQKPTPKDARVKIPTEPGTYPNIFRGVRVEINGDYVRQVPVVTGVPVMGGSIKPDTGGGGVAHKWEAIAQSGNGTLVLDIDDVTKPLVLFEGRQQYS